MTAYGSINCSFVSLKNADMKFKCVLFSLRAVKDTMNKINKPKTKERKKKRSSSQILSIIYSFMW